MIHLDAGTARTWIAAPAGPCAHWCGTQGYYCGSTDSVRLYPVGRRCPAHTPAAVAGQSDLDHVQPAVQPCAGCGHPLDPAAAAGVDGTPAVFDRHPGCEPRIRTLPPRRVARHDKQGRRAA